MTFCIYLSFGGIQKCIIFAEVRNINQYLDVDVHMLIATQGCFGARDGPGKGNMQVHFSSYGFVEVR